MKKKLVQGFVGIFSVVFFMVCINCIFRNLTTTIKFNMEKVLFISLLFMFSIIFACRFFSGKFEKVKKLLDNKIIRITVITLFLLLIITMQYRIAIGYYYPVGWDVKIVRDAARAFILGQDVNYSYFKNFPNNVFLFWIYKNIYYFSTVIFGMSYEFTLVVLNLVVIDLSAILTILVSKKIYGLKSAVLTGVFCMILMIFSPWIVVVYSDTLGMIFPILFMYIYISIWECKNDRNKIILAMFMGMIALIAYQLKPTNIIIIIAMTIVMFLYRMKNKRESIISVALIICIIGTFSISKVIYNSTIGSMRINGIDISDNYAEVIPSTHFLMMGMKERSDDKSYCDLYGGWNEEDYSYTFSIEGKNEKVQANINEIKNRLKNYGKRGYIKFLYNKLNWILNDGTFFYGGEGSFVSEPPFSSDKISTKIQKYYLPTGIHYKRVAYFNESIWLAMLILFSISILNISERREEIVIAMLSITGIVIFLLFFEGRSRYIINHMSMFILLAVNNLKCIDRVVQQIIDKIREEKADFKTLESRTL